MVYDSVFFFWTLSISLKKYDVSEAGSASIFKQKTPALV
jgi:hypothetical protein